MEDFVLEAALFDAVNEIIRLSILKGDKEYKGVDLTDLSSEGIEKQVNAIVDLFIDKVEKEMNLK